MGSEKWLVFISLGSLLISGLFMAEAEGRVTRYYDFVLEETNFTRLCSTKSMLTVNGRFPGPMIEVEKGDTVFVNVHNQGNYGVTIHWHGVKQPRNPWSDGPENITQCPIKPGTNFTQEIIFSEEEGTLWWHAHSDWSRATVHGAIIIRPTNDTAYPFSQPDGEETIILSSWFKGDVMEIINEALISGGEPNQSDAFTINGQPGDLYPCSNASTFRLLVDYGKTYLLRIVNSVMNEELFFAIANHNLTLVGTDAAYVKPFTAGFIMISPGQTMDVLLTATRYPSHYYMAASAFTRGTAPFDNTTVTAIVQYSGNYTPPAAPYFAKLPAYNDSVAARRFTFQFRNLGGDRQPVNVPKTVTRRMFVTVSVNRLICPNASCAGQDGNRMAASLNNISFVTPTIDILEAYYRSIDGVFNITFPDRPPRFFNFTADKEAADTVVPSQETAVKVLKHNESVQIVFQGTNLGPENHPMHLHGFSFYLVGTGLGNFNGTTDEENFNLDDPPIVNTVGVPALGWTAVRFFADNPGVWFMHCHLERHASWGMNTVLIVKNGTTAATSLRPPPAYMPPCS